MVDDYPDIENGLTRCRNTRSALTTNDLDWRPFMAHSNLPVLSHPDFPQDVFDGALARLVKQLSDRVLPLFFEHVIDADPQACITWRAQGHQIFIGGLTESEADQLSTLLETGLPSFIHLTGTFKPHQEVICG
jgi:hypothetical protein